MRRSVFIFLFLSFALLIAGCGAGQSGFTPSPPPSPSPTPPPPPPPPTPSADLTVINHIVFMFQENRSFDHYFGRLNQYRASLGLPQDVDGLPANASNPSYDGTFAITPFHMATVCAENTTPSWNESHVQQNRQRPAEQTGLMDGFVFTAAAWSRTHARTDPEGYRAMGYYDERDLPYYYFMATQFATSDRWFTPFQSRTQPNRLYSLAATSDGHVKPNTVNINRKTIFHLLQEAGISWKIYTTDPGLTYMDNFFPFVEQHADKIVPLDRYFEDLKNGTLPAVALIEGGYRSALDEHPGNNIQKGAAHVAKIINALMVSSSWKDSVFILTYDEPGGLYDHVPPPPAVHPDGIPPRDLAPGDVPGDFDRYGFRVPLIVISPYAKKHYVSHTVADYTAILKFVQKRFNLPSLTNRDAAQMDMTEFFDFNNPPWMTPPTPPAQPTTGVCNTFRVRQ